MEFSETNGIINQDGDAESLSKEQEQCETGTTSQETPSEFSTESVSVPVPDTASSPVAPLLTAEELRSVIKGELCGIKQQMNKIEEEVSKLKVVCKDSLEYGQRYQKNTVLVLQGEIKEKDRYISGMLLVDLLKPVANICSKIERRIGRTLQQADKKFLQDILDDIMDTVKDDYGVEISSTETGCHRPENISKVEGVVPTGDPLLTNLVAESISPAWTINGKLIQKESVNVYKFDEALISETDESLKNSGQENEKAEPEGVFEAQGNVISADIEPENNGMQEEIHEEVHDDDPAPEMSSSRDDNVVDTTLHETV